MMPSVRRPICRKRQTANAPPKYARDQESNPQAGRRFNTPPRSLGFHLNRRLSACFLISECVGARTRDLRIKSPLLYQLSYTPNGDGSRQRSRVVHASPMFYGVRHIFGGACEIQVPTIRPKMSQTPACERLPGAAAGLTSMDDAARIDKVTAGRAMARVYSWSNSVWNGHRLHDDRQRINLLRSSSSAIAARRSLT